MKIKNLLITFIISISFGATTLDNPYKVAVDIAGNYYVADTLHNSVKKYLPDGSFYEIPYNFNQPQAITIDHDNNIYVVDTGSNRVLKFKSTEQGFAYSKALNVNLSYPRDIDISPSGKYIYILDSGNNSVLRIRVEKGQESSDLRFGELDGAYGLCVDPAGDIFVANTLKHQILKFSEDGKLLHTYGQEGTNKGDFSYPKDVAVGYSGFIIVADSGNQRIQRLSEDGHFLNEIKLPHPSSDIRGLALNKQKGILYISGAGLDHIISINLGFKIKKFSVDNEYFSPNNNKIKDYPCFKIELFEPTDLSIDIFRDGILFEHVTGLKNATEFQKINWLPGKKTENGSYDYLFYCSDPQATKEPYIIQGKLTVDLEPPAFEEFSATPNTISPDGDGINDQVNFKASFQEDAALQVEILTSNKEKTLFTTLLSDTTSQKQNIVWNGENKYKEINNGTYHYSARGIDKAGNISPAKEGELFINYEHPLIIKVITSAKQTKKNAIFNITYTIASASQVRIIIKKIDDTFNKVILARALPAGEYKKELNLEDLANGEYSLLIEAKKENITDSYSSRLLIDYDPPKLSELAITKKELSGTSLDKTTVSFKTNEKAFCKAYLKDLTGKIIEQLCNNLPIAPDTHFEFSFNGQDKNEHSLPMGRYILALEINDELGNSFHTNYEIKIISSIPQFKRLALSSDILGIQGYGTFRYIEFKYELTESLGDLFVSLRILKNGELVETIADRQKRLRGLNYDYWKARSDLTDGVYQYELSVRDDFGHFSQKTGDIYVINQLPSLKGFTFSQDVFSPANQDGHKDTEVFSFSSIISNSLILKSIAPENNTTSQNILPRKVKLIINIDNNKFEVYEENGPHQFVWDGKDSNGKYMIDGSYNYEVYAIDAIGQESNRITGSIAISNSPDKITYFRLDINGLPSPNGTFNPFTGNTTVTLNYGMGNFPTWQKMTSSIYTPEGSLIRTLPIKTFNGSGNYTAVWDGTTDTGSHVNDGKYLFQINIVDGIGNNFNFTSMGSRVPSVNYRDEIFAVAETEKTYLYSLANNGGEPRLYYQRGIKNPRYEQQKTGEAFCAAGSLPQQNISTPLLELPYTQTIFVNIASGGNYIPADTYLSIDGGITTTNISFSKTFSAYSTEQFLLQAASTGSGSATANYSLSYYYYNYSKFFIDSINFKNWHNKTGPVLQSSPWSYPQSTTLNCYGYSHTVWTDDTTLYYKRGNGSLFTNDIVLFRGAVLDPVLTTFNNELYVLWGDNRPNIGDIRLQKIPQYFLPVENSGFIVSGLSSPIKNYKQADIHILSSGIPQLISPKNGETINEAKPIFIWESPTWAIMTSTNYDLNISPENDIFGQVDDIILSLSPSQLAFSGASMNIVSYKLPESQALSTDFFYWRILAKDNLISTIHATSNIESFNLEPSLDIDKQINYPNPFTDKTTIRYKLTQDADVTIRIFNIAGQLVKTMEFDSSTEGGKASNYFDPYNDIEWDGTNDFNKEVVNDPYIYEIKAQRGSKTAKARGKMVKWK